MAMKARVPAIQKDGSGAAKNPHQPAAKIYDNPASSSLEQQLRQNRAQVEKTMNIK